MLIKNKTWRFVVGLLLLILIIGIAMQIAIHSSLIPPYDEICQPNEYTQQKECANQHVALVAIWQVGKFLNYWGTALTAIFTLLIAVFTFGLLLDGKSKAEKELRAYVTVTRATIDDWLVTDTPTARLEITNCGKTPAKELEVLGYMHICEFPLATILPEFTVADLPARSKMVLGPNVVRDKEQTWGVNFPNPKEERRPLTEQQRTALMAEKAAIYVYGEILYKDILGQNQVTQYRYFSNGLTVERRPGKLIPHNEGNEAT